MAKSRRKDAAGGTEFGNLVDLDVKRRAAQRAREDKERGERKKVVEEERQGKLIKRGGTEKEKRARIAALYSDLRTAYNEGELQERQVRDYLEDFPSSAEYRAFEEIFEAIREGEAKKEGEKLKVQDEEDIQFLEHGRLGEEEKKSQRRNKILREAIGDRLGLSDLPRQLSETKGERFKTEEWRRALLREYAEGKINDEDINNFFTYYSEEKKTVYEKLAEEERIKVKREEISENKLSREEVEEMLMRGLGVREELIKDIPTEEGKTLFEEMFDNQIEIFKGMLLDTVSRADYEKKIEEAGGDREKAEREIIAEEAKKFLAARQLFTHGVIGYDREKGQVVLRRYSDLDGKCAMALFGKVGIDLKKVAGYLTPGEKKQGQITVDSSNADGLVTDSVETVDQKTGERKVEVTTVLDHHGPHSDHGTSATKNVYKFLTELGLLKFEDEKDQKNYEKVVEWVTQSDNFNFPDMEKYFQTSDHRMIGFLKTRSVTLNTLLNFADSGKEVTDELGEGDLRRLGLIYRKKDGEIVDRAADRREVIKKTMETVRELAAKGWTVITKDGKRFLVDTQNKIGGEGQWAAASIGYDGVARYTPETHNFFVALNKGTFDEKTFAGLSQGRLIRGSVFIKLSGGEKLTVTLSDLLGKLAPDFKPGPKTELQGFLDTEPRRIRAIVSLVEEKRMEKRRGKPLKEIVEDHYWWTNAPDGKKVIVKSVPGDFKPGGELYVRLREPTEEDKKRYGMQDFYVGFFEPDEIILPKKPVEKKEPAKAEAEPAKREVAPKPEVKSAEPAAEKPVTPEERRREVERIIRQTLADERRRLFAEFLKLLQESPVYGGRSRVKLERMAREQIEVKIKFVERDLREKYKL